MKKIDFSLIAIAVSVLTFYGYFIAYSYEVGYFSAFEIPSALVQISLNSVIIATLSVLTLLSITVVTPILARPFLKKYRNRLFLYPLILFCVLLTVITGILLLLDPKNLFYLPLLATMTALLILYADFFYPVLKHRSIKNFRENVIGDRGSSDSKNEFLSSVIPKNTYINLGLASMLLLIVSYRFTSDIGNTTAILGSKNYYVFNNMGKTYALIRSYTSTILAVRYQNNTLIPGDVLVLNTERLSLKKTRLNLPKSKLNDDAVQRFNQFILYWLERIKNDFPRFINWISDYFARTVNPQPIKQSK